jgi:uncharacterized membrane protein
MGVASGRHPTRRLGLAGRRAVVGAAAAAAGVAVAVGSGASWPVDVLAAWDAAALVFLALVWHAVGTKDAAATAQLAQDEDDSHRSSEAMLLAASVASLIAVAFVLAEAGREHHAARAGLTLLALGSVALAWACVHTVFALRYARLYYTPPIGGVGFHQNELPDYQDFAYVALTIGMTFQVSDTDIAKKGIRRTAIHHALLSYLFGAVILAIAINTVATLLGR